MSFKIGVQVYSVNKEANEDFATTMKKIKEMGYDGVELAGEYGQTAEAIRDTLKELDLIPFSAHVGLDAMYDEPEKTFSFYKTVGVTYIVVPWLPEESRPGNEAFYEIVRKVGVVGKTAREYGLKLLYHNHDFEFNRVKNGQYGLDYLYDTVPAEDLQTELDTCWVNVGGENPADYVRKYAGRAPVVHLKDFYKKEGSSNEGLYELIGVNKKFVRNEGFEFRAVGHGLQDIPSIIAAAEDANAEWLVVEQDRPSQGLTAMEGIDISRKYLRSIGL